MHWWRAKKTLKMTKEIFQKFLLISKPMTKMSKIVMKTGWIFEEIWQKDRLDRISFKVKKKLKSLYLDQFLLVHSLWLKPQIKAKMVGITRLLASPNRGTPCIPKAVSRYEYTKVSIFYNTDFYWNYSIL